MKCVLTILLAAVAVLLTVGADAQPAVASASKTSPPKKRKKVDRGPLFFGRDRLGASVPQTDLLPTSTDVEKLGEKLSSRERNVDPFGLATFPRDEAMPIMEDDLVRVTTKTTLNQALQTLKVNGVSLARKEFMIGGRTACEGDVLEIEFRSETFQAQVLEVTPTEILFRDLVRNEGGVLRHSVVPHLEIEPLQKVASQFEERMTPLEPPTPPQR
jgi:hypothetical protein